MTEREVRAQNPRWRKEEMRKKKVPGRPSFHIPSSIRPDRLLTLFCSSCANERRRGCGRCWILLLWRLWLRGCAFNGCSSNAHWEAEPPESVGALEDGTHFASSPQFNIDLIVYVGLPGMSYPQIAMVWSIKLAANLRQRFVFPFLPILSRYHLLSPLYNLLIANRKLNQSIANVARAISIGNAALVRLTLPNEKNRSRKWV